MHSLSLLQPFHQESKFSPGYDIPSALSTEPELMLSSEPPRSWPQFLLSYLSLGSGCQGNALPGAHPSDQMPSVSCDATLLKPRGCECKAGGVLYYFLPLLSTVSAEASSIAPSQLRLLPECNQNQSINLTCLGHLMQPYANGDGEQEHKHVLQACLSFLFFPFLLLFF